MTLSQSIQIKVGLIGSLLIFSLGCANSQIESLPRSVYESSHFKPTPGASESIGFYSKGCLLGAKTFVGNEKGLVVSQMHRGRFWGHPELIALLTEVGERFYKANKKKIILGDLGLPRGGPTFSGHNSHQNGLDVDVWFKVIAAHERLDLNQIETEDMGSVFSGGALDVKKWSVDQIELVRQFTDQAKVERIFINAKLKKFFCENKQELKLNDKQLAKLRAWYGHDDHIHVRLSCPANSPSCEKQEPVDAGSGCDQLDWWFSDEAVSTNFDYSFEALNKTYNEVFEKLPARCQSILTEY